MNNLDKIDNAIANHRCTSHTSILAILLTKEDKKSLNDALAATSMIKQEDIDASTYLGYPILTHNYSALLVERITAEAIPI